LIKSCGYDTWYYSRTSTLVGVIDPELGRHHSFIRIC